MICTINLCALFQLLELHVIMTNKSKFIINKSWGIFFGEDQRTEKNEMKESRQKQFFPFQLLMLFK